MTADTLPAVAEIDAMIQKLSGVTEEDAYAHPWTFGEICGGAAAMLAALRVLRVAETYRGALTKEPQP